MAAVGSSVPLRGLTAYSVKQTGEYLVAAELCRREVTATTFSGNMPRFDMLVIRADGQALPIQVKTIRAGDWQISDARSLLRIELSRGIQRILGPVRLADPSLVFVFVKLRGPGQDEFYVCRAKDVQGIVLHGYKSYLGRIGGRRSKNPASMHTAISAERLVRFRDNWTLITGQELQP